MKIGLFFGSFNPMHVGHKIITSYLVEFSDLEKILFVVSPQNPLKQKELYWISIMSPDNSSEVEDNPKLDVSDIEFNMHSTILYY